ncbi:molecular chaperone TorD family protein [Embleya sp. NBC_00896]|uniref:nitrate reductase molybdenum cofactor assembly chaperone n=1 Tax=Embleya sp. NBC_00896 TaxID=2975961 RepID=UPI002F914160
MTAALPGPVAAPLYRFLDHAEATDVDDLAAEYVAVFDNRRRCCPFLTYYAHGDTHKRGVALLSMKQTHAAAGLRLSDDELPRPLGRRSGVRRSRTRSRPQAVAGAPGRAGVAAPGPARRVRSQGGRPGIGVGNPAPAPNTLGKTRAALPETP